MCYKLTKPPKRPGICSLAPWQWQHTSLIRTLSCLFSSHSSLQAQGTGKAPQRPRAAGHQEITLRFHRRTAKDSQGHFQGEFTTF